MWSQLVVCSLTFTLMSLVSSEQDKKESWILKNSLTLRSFSYWPYLWKSGDAFSLRHHCMVAHHWGKKTKKRKIYTNIVFFLLTTFSCTFSRTALLGEWFKDTVLKGLQGVGDKYFVRGLWTLLLEDRTSESPVNWVGYLTSYLQLMML